MVHYRFIRDHPNAEVELFSGPQDVIDIHLNNKRIDSTIPLPYLLKLRSFKLFILSTIYATIITDIFLYSNVVPVKTIALSSRVGVPEFSVQSWVSVLVAFMELLSFFSSPFAGCAQTRRRVGGCYC